jgi:crotonobetainyl-CoA:carnitine CoA-transferase CaiB-like acyl-CoA transferase
MWSASIGPTPMPGKPMPGNPVSPDRDVLNRGKRSIQLDLQDRDDRAKALQLVRSAKRGRYMGY